MSGEKLNPQRRRMPYTRQEVVGEGEAAKPLDHRWVTGHVRMCLSSGSGWHVKTLWTLLLKGKHSTSYPLFLLLLDSSITGRTRAGACLEGRQGTQTNGAAGWVLKCGSYIRLCPNLESNRCRNPRTAGPSWLQPENCIFPIYVKQR